MCTNMVPIVVSFVGFSPRYVDVAEAAISVFDKDISISFRVVSRCGRFPLALICCGLGSTGHSNS